MVSEQVKRWVKTWKGKEYYKDWIVTAETNDKWLDDFFAKKKEEQKQIQKTGAFVNHVFNIKEK